MTAKYYYEMTAKYYYSITAEHYSEMNINYYYNLYNFNKIILSNITNKLI